MRSLFRKYLGTPTYSELDITRQALYEGCKSILDFTFRGTPLQFKLSVNRSHISGAGLGITVSEGLIKRGDVVSLYAGTYCRQVDTSSCLMT